MISHIDHFVLTVTDITQTIAFYTTTLNMTAITFGNNRHALTFGDQKINLHECHSSIHPKAKLPTPGSQDFCLITNISIADMVKKLNEKNIPIINGPVKRTGAVGELVSIYINDPDGNLIEIANIDG